MEKFPRIYGHTIEVQVEENREADRTIRPIYRAVCSCGWECDYRRNLWSAAMTEAKEHLDGIARARSQQLTLDLFR